ncbi:MAG: hypothetical protein IKM82_02405 [Oscillospiraceae bacterium]|nr:hypothetical protein [Oscillospiraceae bacterium]MBR6839426.1 hypothetical protein [Oscillospiraceae bacterium]
MKKGLMCFVSMVCVIAMLVSMGSVSFAQETKYKSTHRFLNYMDELGIPYKYYGIDDKNWEAVVINFDTFGLSTFSGVECFIYFEQDDEEVCLRIWDLVKPSAGKNYTLSTINDLNDYCPHVDFVFDENHSTIFAQIDMFIHINHCSSLVFKAMEVLYNTLEDEEISQALKGLE